MTKAGSQNSQIYRVEIACTGRPADETTRECCPTTELSGGAPTFKRMTALPDTTATVGRVHFIPTRPLQRFVRRLRTNASP